MIMIGDILGEFKIIYIPKKMEASKISNLKYTSLVVNRSVPKVHKSCLTF